MSITLCVRLWAVPQREELLIAYEDAVLELLVRQGGRVLSRVRISAGSSASPFETQVIEMPSREALQRFLEHPDRLELSAQREESVARTETDTVMRIV